MKKLRRALFTFFLVFSYSYSQTKTYAIEDLLGRWIQETPTMLTEIVFAEKGDGSVVWKTIQEGKVLEESKKEGVFYYVFDSKLPDVIVLSFFNSSGEFLAGSKYKIDPDVKKYPQFLCLVKLKASGEEDLDEIFRLVEKKDLAQPDNQEALEEINKSFAGTWIQRDARGSVRLEIGSGPQAGKAKLIYQFNRTKKTFSRSANFYINVPTKILSLDVLEDNNKLVRYFFKLSGSDILQEVDAAGFDKVSSKGNITSFTREGVKG